MEVKLSNENFNKEVLNSEKPVLVDFWATWCGPCKMIAPIISEISEEFNNKVKVGKVNVDEDVEKLEPLCTAGRNVKWYRKTVW